MLKKKKDRKVLGPIVLIGIITLLIMIASAVLSWLNFGSQEGSIGTSVEMSLINVNNIFSKDGISYLLSSSVTNFRLLEPLVLFILSLIAASIAETSGLIKHISEPLKKISLTKLIFLTMILSVVFTFFGEYSFVILLPLIGIVYKYLGRSPMLGILIVFIGVTIGYGTGIIYNYNTFSLGKMTELAASIEVDKTFKYNVLSCSYIMIASTFLITIIGTPIIKKYIAPKFKRVEFEDDGLVISNKALWGANFVMLIFLIAIVLMILPGGILLDNSASTYIEKLMGESSPFKDAFMPLFLFSMLGCGAIYGKISGNIKTVLEYNVGLYKSFQNTGYVFVLMYFASIMMGVFNWTNIGEVINAKLINILSSLTFSGSLLIIIFFIFAIIMGFLVPNSLTKWKMASPLIVPLFMRANITPEFTQFIFSVSDGIGKSLSPLYIYFIIMLGLLQKYNDDNKKEITIYGIIKILLPVILILAGTWLLLIISWNIVGLPLGMGSYSTI